jgi:hypothetical protein
VVNNNDLMPTEGCANDPAKGKPFNSYNQPSVDLDALVVIRARSRGGPGETGGTGGGGTGGGGIGGGGAGSGMGGITVSAGGAGGSSGSDTDHGNQPVHGIYTRDMSAAGSSIVKILDRKTAVPQPNNLARMFHKLAQPTVPQPMCPDMEAAGCSENVWAALDGGKIV